MIVFYFFAGSLVLLFPFLYIFKKYKQEYGIIKLLGTMLTYILLNVVLLYNYLLIIFVSGEAMINLLIIIARGLYMVPYAVLIIGVIAFLDKFKENINGTVYYIALLVVTNIIFLLAFQNIHYPETLAVPIFQLLVDQSVFYFSVAVGIILIYISMKVIPQNIREEHETDTEETERNERRRRTRRPRRTARTRRTEENHTAVKPFDILILFSVFLLAISIISAVMYPESVDITIWIDFFLIILIITLFLVTPERDVLLRVIVHDIKTLFSRFTSFTIFLILFVLLIITTGKLGIFGATLAGYIILLTIALSSLGSFIVSIKKFGQRISRNKLVSLLLIVVVACSLFSITLIPIKLRGNVDDGWANDLGFTINTNTSEFPIDIFNVRLVDRDLAKDFARSYRLPKIGNYQLHVDFRYENIGIINGSPAWILPVYYSYAVTKEINYLVGYLYIHLETPTFESMKFVKRTMIVAPGLYGSRDIFYFTMNLVPDGTIGELYLVDPSPVTSSPAWVVLIDRYSPWGVRIPYKVLIVGANGDYKLYDYMDARGIVPQVISHVSFESIVKVIGATMREGQKDYFAQGFIWIPPSQDIQGDLSAAFYNRAHHFLISNYWGRDYYRAIQTSTGEESVTVWTLINTTVTLFDLRFYRGIGGVIRGVNSPDKALKSMSIPYGGVPRYPKLYRIDLNESYLVWVALVVQPSIGADKPLGVAWVDASNTRISGFVQYVYGESHDVFMKRLYQSIQASYEGWATGNLTTLKTTTINGTIIRKNWALLQPDNQYAIIMSIANNTGDILTVIVLENKVAAKQDFYNAVLAKEGDRVVISARWDIELQAWVAYTIELYPSGGG